MPSSEPRASHAMVRGELPPPPWTFISATKQASLGLASISGHGGLAVTDEGCAACKILESDSVDR